MAPFAVVPQELLTAAAHAQAVALAVEDLQQPALRALAAAPYAGFGLAGAFGDAVGAWQRVLGERAHVVRAIADGLRATADAYLEVEDRVTCAIDRAHPADAGLIDC